MEQVYFRNYCYNCCDRDRLALHTEEHHVRWMINEYILPPIGGYKSSRVQILVIFVLSTCL